MKSKRTITFIVFYLSMIILILFTYFYLQKHYSYEATHKRSERIILDPRH